MAVPSFERPFHPQKRFLEGKKGLQASFVPNCILPAAVINQLFIYVNGLTGRQTMTHAVSRNSSDLQKKIICPKLCKGRHREHFFGSAVTNSSLLVAKETVL
jgi:hypothetical protein